MKLSVEVNGRELRLEFKCEQETCRFRFESESERCAELQQVEPGVYCVLLDGRSYEVKIARNVVEIDGWRFFVEVRDPRRWIRNTSGSHGGGRQNVAAFMPGKVIRLLVAEGDTVQAGQGLIVVEAMKMQNEMKAAKAGRVASVKAREGATVSAGEVLLSIE
jgi:biotin carboxyl carrier protein